MDIESDGWKIWRCFVIASWQFSVADCKRMARFSKRKLVYCWCRKSLISYFRGDNSRIDFPRFVLKISLGWIERQLSNQNSCDNLKWFSLALTTSMFSRIVLCCTHDCEIMFLPNYSHLFVHFRKSRDWFIIPFRRFWHRLELIWNKPHLQLTFDRRNNASRLRWNDT